MLAMSRVPDHFRTRYPIRYLQILLATSRVPGHLLIRYCIHKTIFFCGARGAWHAFLEGFQMLEKYGTRIRYPPVPIGSQKLLHSTVVSSVERIFHPWGNYAYKRGWQVAYLLL